MHLLKILTLPDFIANLWLSLQDQERNLSKEFRARGRSISHGAPTQHNLALPWDFAIVTPPVEDTPAIAQALYDLGKPFAILVPGDLVYLIAMRADRHDVTLQEDGYVFKDRIHGRQPRMALLLTGRTKAPTSRLYGRRGRATSSAPLANPSLEVSNPV